jgi:histidinol-phosphatase (PHP family)
MALDAGLDFALSSDAHVADQLGHGYDEAAALLEDLGVREICVFEGRQRRLEPLGA